MRERERSHLLARRVIEILPDAVAGVVVGVVPDEGGEGGGGEEVDQTEEVLRLHGVEDEVHGVATLPLGELARGHDDAVEGGVDDAEAESPQVLQQLGEKATPKPTALKVSRISRKTTFSSSGW